MFVDLVGSTAYKEQNPAEEVWLARLAAFLTAVTEIVSAHGRVVKYIGDEVMAVFEASDAVLHAEHAAELIVSFCLRSGDMNFQVKIGLDLGKASFLTFPDLGQNGSAMIGDPQGTVVDRCARIVGQALPNTILTSQSFVDASGSRSRWRLAGTLKPKGFSQKLRIFQLRFAESEGSSVVLREELSSVECQKELAETRRMLEELKAMR
jgi:class 3 adenylate cyclase